MQREGHVGLGLALYAPPGFVLLQVGRPDAFGLGLVAMAVWSVAPDVDVPLPIPHRGPTHSVVAAGVAGAVTAAITVVLTSAGVAGHPAAGASSPGSSQVAAVAVGAYVGAGGVIGHLLGDVLTPKGIRPWWPLSDRKYTFEVVLASNKRANRALVVTGVSAVVCVTLLAEVA